MKTSFHNCLMVSYQGTPLTPKNPWRIIPRKRTFTTWPQGAAEPRKSGLPLTHNFSCLSGKEFSQIPHCFQFTSLQSSSWSSCSILPRLSRPGHFGVFQTNLLQTNLLCNLGPIYVWCFFSTTFQPRVFGVLWWNPLSGARFWSVPLLGMKPPLPSFPSIELSLSPCQLYAFWGEMLWDHADLFLFGRPPAKGGIHRPLLPDLPLFVSCCLPSSREQACLFQALSRNIVKFSHFCQNNKWEMVSLCSFSLCSSYFGKSEHFFMWLRVICTSVNSPFLFLDFFLLLTGLFSSLF